MKIIDKYIIKQYLTTFFVMFGLFIPIGIMVDFAEKIDITASGVLCSAHNTMTQDNVQAAIEQLESQFGKGETDPTPETEPFLDEGDLFYNTNTNQLKVYRGSGTWDILLQAEGDMDTLDGSTF